ncbi:photosynthetic reaction center subunit H [Sandarakinorhabdus sp.]|uniref:photosynthetic reaction center subunit H n=1 Tax=Sandarakinorhabdus sp. TaxID=1916663 RepID=UPI00286E700A|nr:photosynthetic reaction center subunit H [Sandarakinorhabdus sp.]
MKNVHLVGGLDIAELAFFLFFFFFLGLVWYLRREDRREGYPLEWDVTGQRLDLNDPLIFDEPKTFVLPHGLGTFTTPTANDRDELPTNIWPENRGYEGTPFEPKDNHLSSGLGPASYAQRFDRPDLDMHGDPRIVPTRVAPHIGVVAQDIDPRGLTVFGVDGKAAGTVSDLWVDKSEHMLRYLEVELTSGDGHVLLPMAMSEVSRRGVVTDSITAAQFAGAPRPKTADQVTLLEEDKIVGYFGGGYLWATPERSEPLL